MVVIVDDVSANSSIRDLASPVSFASRKGKNIRQIYHRLPSLVLLDRQFGTFIIHNVYAFVPVWEELEQPRRIVRRHTGNHQISLNAQRGQRAGKLGCELLTSRPRFHSLAAPWCRALTTNRCVHYEPVYCIQD